MPIVEDILMQIAQRKLKITSKFCYSDSGSQPLDILRIFRVPC